MAILKDGILLGDKIHAYVQQVIDLCNNHPPVKAPDICHPCFPGYMAGTTGLQDWRERYEVLLQEVDSRMIVLHDANLINRKCIKIDGKERIGYHVRDQRRKIVDLPEELACLPFHEIKPNADERFPKA